MWNVGGYSQLNNCYRFSSPIVGPQFSLPCFLPPNPGELPFPFNAIPQGLWGGLAPSYPNLFGGGYTQGGFTGGPFGLGGFGGGLGGFNTPFGGSNLLGGLGSYGGYGNIGGGFGSPFGGFGGGFGGGCSTGFCAPGQGGGYNMMAMLGGGYY